MRFVEIDLLGVYVAPISLMLVGAWLITLALRRMANHAACTFGIRRCSRLPHTSSFSHPGS
jgi:hypothetical protein